MRPQSVVELSELVAATPGAEARLWRFLAELDLVAIVKAGDRPTDEALPWLLDERPARQAGRRSFDFIWVRPLDVARLLTTRSYATTGRVVLEVVDAQGLAGGPLRARRVARRGDVRRPRPRSAELTMSRSTRSARRRSAASTVASLHAGRVARRARRRAAAAGRHAARRPRSPRGATPGSDTSAIGWPEVGRTVRR